MKIKYDYSMAETSTVEVYDPSIDPLGKGDKGLDPPEWGRRRTTESKDYDTRLEYGFEMQHTSPEISALTVKASAESMLQHFKSIESIDKNLLNNDPAYETYRNFQVVLDGIYREKNAGKGIDSIANDDKALGRFMESIMKDERHVLWAVKIAESQMAVLEAGTGVHTFVDSEPEPRLYVPTPDVFNPENDDPEKPRLLEDEDMKTERRGWNKIALWMRPVKDRANNLVRKIQKVAAKELDIETSKRTQAVATIEFRKRPWQRSGDISRLYTQIDHVNGQPSPITINGRPLDKVQEAYLRSIPGLSVVAPGDPLTEKAKASIVREVRRKNKARMNAYAHWGMDLVDDYDFNMVHTDPFRPSSGDHFYNTRIDNPSIVLDSFGIPKVNGNSLEVAVGAGSRGNNLDTQIEVLQGGLRENINELVKKKRPAEVLPAVNDQVALLEEEAKKHRNPERVKQIDDEEIPRYQDLEKYYKERKQLEKEKSNIVNEEFVITQRLNDPSGIQDTQGRDISHQEILFVYQAAQQSINTAQSAVHALNETINSIDKALEPDKNRLSKLQDELVAIGGQLGSKSISQDNKDILNARRSELIRRINGGAEIKDAQGNVISPAIQGLLPKVEAMESARDAAIRDRIGKDTALQTKINEFENLKSAIPESKYNTAKKFSDDRDALRVQSDAKYTEIVNLERGAATKLLKNVDDPSKGTWTEQEVKDKIAALALEKDLAQKPERNIERRLNAYKELQAILKPEELKNVYERARESVYSPRYEEHLAEAIKAHGELPPGYLATILKVYGPEIMLPGKKEQFKKATAWLTPELFVDTLRQSGQPVDSIYHPMLRTIQVAKMVDGEFIHKILDKAMTEAKAGTLGERPTGETEALQIIDTTPALDLTEERTKNNQTVESAIDSMRRSIPVAEARIHLQRIPALSTMSRQQLYPYIQTFQDVYGGGRLVNVSPLPSDATETEVLQYFNKVHSNVPQDQAQEIVHTLYGLYNRGVVAESVHKVAMTIHKDPEEATKLAAAAMLIDNTEDQEQFLASAEQGQSLTMIRDSLQNLPPQDRPSYFHIINQMIEDVENLYALNPNATRQDVKDMIDDVMYEEKLSMLGPRANSPDVLAELGEQSKVLDTLYDRESMNLYIDQMDLTIYYANDASELTLRIIEHSKLSYSNPDTVRYHKMVAEEIMRRRRKV